MSNPTHAVHVRMKSKLTHDEIVQIMNDRAPEFRALDGLEQKYYLHDPATGEYGGFYVWRSLDDVVQYRASDLAASIAAAYQSVAAPEITVYEIVMPLRT